MKEYPDNFCYKIYIKWWFYIKDPYFKYDENISRDFRED